MSLERHARAMRAIGGFSGGSRLARPPQVLQEPDVRPDPGDQGVSVAFTKYSGVLFSDAFSEAIVTEEGAVNYYRNGFGGLTGFRPICGESRFSTFTIAGTGSGAALYGGQGHIEWPYLYLNRQSPTRTIWKVNLTAGTMTQATASPGSGPDYSDIVSLDSEGYALAVRGLTAGTAEVREWTKASEPSASTSQVMALDAPYDLESIVLDADENIWVSGTDGYVLMYDAFGSLQHSIQLPGYTVVEGPRYVSGLVAPIGLSGVLTFLPQPSDLEHHWFHVLPDGTYSDITADVTVDGVPWLTTALGDFGDPLVQVTNYNDRIGFVDGTDFYIGVVST